MAAPDLLTTEVIAHRLHSTAEEMLATLVKTAYSPNIKERRDCSTAIFPGGDTGRCGISARGGAEGMRRFARAGGPRSEGCAACLIGPGRRRAGIFD